MAPSAEPHGAQTAVSPPRPNSARSPCAVRAIRHLDRRDADTLDAGEVPEVDARGERGLLVERELTDECTEVASHAGERIGVAPTHQRVDLVTIRAWSGCCSPEENCERHLVTGASRHRGHRSHAVGEAGRARREGTPPAGRRGDHQGVRRCRDLPAGDRRVQLVLHQHRPRGVVHRVRRQAAAVQRPRRGVVVEARWAARS